MSSHRADSCSDKDTRKSRAVRLGAVLLAVVGVTAAATSAGFSDQAWFSANASSAGVELEGKLANDAEYQLADDGDLAIKIPSTTFDNMLPDETRTVELDLQNSSTVPLELTQTTAVAGDLLDKDSGTQVTVTGFDPELAADETTKATLTVIADDWSDTLQNEKHSDNTITVTFTGTPKN